MESDSEHNTPLLNDTLIELRHKMLDTTLSGEERQQAKTEIKEAITGTQEDQVEFEGFGFDQDDDFAQQITDAILANSNITDVSFFGSNMSADNLARMIRNGTHLKELTADANSLEGNDMGVIVGALKQNRTLEKLDMSNNEIGTEGAIELLGALAFSQGAMSNGLNDLTFSVDSVDEEEAHLKTNIGLALGRACTRLEKPEATINVNDEVWGELSFTRASIIDMPDNEKILGGMEYNAPRAVRALREQINNNIEHEGRT